MNLISKRLSWRSWNQNRNLIAVSCAIKSDYVIKETKSSCNALAPSSLRGDRTRKHRRKSFHKGPSVGFAPMSLVGHAQKNSVYRVRFTPRSGRLADMPGRPLVAIGLNRSRGRTPRLMWKIVAHHPHCTRANSNPASSTVIVCTIAPVGPSPGISTQAELQMR
jgi:hypothetical protein